MSEDTKKDDVEFEIEDELEIEVQDDTPPEDRDKPRRPEGTEPDLPSEDELEKYSDSVKKRINKLTFEFHEERRRKEESERLREEAIKFAEAQRKEADELRKRLSEGQTAVVQQAKSRAETQFEQAKADFKRAYEAGDADALVAAQVKMASLQTELDRLTHYRPAPTPTPAPSAAVRPESSPPQVQQPPARALEWAKANPWFQKDPEMTALALGVHERLVRSGVDPTSETYYTELDSAMRSRFPEQFDAPEPRPQARQAGTVVAPAARATATPRKVSLTQSQVALAKRLGVPLKEYAAQVMKEQNRG
jgi:hypothetical protein